MEPTLSVEMQPQVISLDVSCCDECAMGVESPQVISLDVSCFDEYTMGVESPQVIPMDVSCCDEYTMELESPIRPQYTDDIDEYDGSYTVIPEFEAQSLSTKNKLLKSDIEVEPISVSRVSNLSGGTTVYIGGIFDA